MTEEPLVDRATIARHFGVSPTTIYRWEKAGMPSYRRFQQSWPRYRIAECEAWHGLRPAPPPAGQQRDADLAVLRAEIAALRRDHDRLIARLTAALTFTETFTEPRGPDESRNG